MKQKCPVIRISVRNLVEFILREGDIDNRMAGGQDAQAMQLGSKMHQKIQRRMGAKYQAEVPLQAEVECAGFCLHVEGRADGVVEEEEGITVDEIKCIRGQLERINEPVEVHLAQAKCYAWIVGTQKNLRKITVQMTYCQLETEEIKRFHQEYTVSELEEWFYEVVRQYEKWAKFQMEWRLIRNTSIKKIEFPFEYRKGQKDLVACVYRTILRKKKLFIQAPTGVGKTMATVFPAVKAVGQELGEKIFYLTAKTITRTVAEQAFQRLKEQGLKYKVITLTAKEKICFCEEMQCNPEYCPYAKGHFCRVNDAVYDLLVSTDEMTRESIEEYARKHNVCPFEMALDVSNWVDAVICDYNYVFDPSAHLRRFFSEGASKGHLFLIDEAHNLVERGRQMYSVQIYKEDFLAINHLVKTEDARLSKGLKECNKILLTMKKECQNYRVQDSISHFYLKLVNVMVQMERYLEICEKREIREEVLKLYFEVRCFINTYERLDENYVIYSEFQEDRRFMLKLFCVNPASNLQEFLDKGNSTVFFSATLLPIQYYKMLLSTEKDDYAIYAETSFNKERRLLVNGTDVSTRYRMRTDHTFRKYAQYIVNTVQAKPGNYMAFFPSYQFMECVYMQTKYLLKETGQEVECIQQSYDMNEEARELFLEAFEEERTSSLVGFCIMGGIFAEGIDLTEEKLIGAFIVGTGLPQVCNEREILKDYFQRLGMRGFDYAYLYPGMNKVLQAAGRVIRTEDDRGIILLLDDRFRERRCQESFPKEWADCRVCRLNEIEKIVRGFWEKQESSNL